jgi:hypothetical protein
MGETTGGELNALLDDLHKPRFALKRPGAAVALGWHTPVGKPGSSFVWKDGQTLGYSAYIGFATQTKAGVVLLANSARCPAVRIGTLILAGLSGQAPPTLESAEGTQ